MRRLALSAAFLATALLSRSAAADAKACVAASEEGQTLRTNSKFTAAKAAYARCAASECPGIIRTECEKQLAAVDAATPTVTFGAKVDGADVAEVAVTVDGVVVASRLDGHADVTQSKIAAFLDPSGFKF